MRSLETQSSVLRAVTANVAVWGRPLVGRKEVWTVSTLSGGGSWPPAAKPPPRTISDSVGVKACWASIAATIQTGS